MDFSDAIEKTLRYIQPRPPQQCRLYANYTAASGTMKVNAADPGAQAIRPGSLIESGENVLYVVAVSLGTDTGASNTLTVVGGYQGSTDANASSGTLVSVNPRFSRWDCSVAINDEIVSLSAPSVGLGQIETIQLTYIPTYDGYDLGTDFDSATSKVLGVSYKIVPPTKRHPPIRRGEYRVIRDNVDGDFPSGNGIILSNNSDWGDGWGTRAQPGFPITVVFLSPYAPLVNLADDLLTVGGIQTTVQDIVVYGAAIRVASSREIQRNSAGSQSDPRKATEVPPGAMNASVNTLAAIRQQRINQEADRITRRYPNVEWR